MRLLLDTHYAAWVAVAPERLSSKELELLQDNEVIASAISIWELRIKWPILDRRGNRKGPADPRSVLEGLSALEIEMFALTAAHAAATLERPIAHNDPFDQALLIHAQELDAKLLTRDRELARHPLAITA